LIFAICSSRHLNQAGKRKTIRFLVGCCFEPSELLCMKFGFSQTGTLAQGREVLSL